jgi:hypothetical protein
LGLSTHLRADAMVGLGAGFHASISLWWFNLNIDKTFAEYRNKDNLIDYTIEPLTYIKNINWGGIPDGLYRGDYYNNKTLAGSSVNSRFDKKIDYYWGTNSPLKNINSSDISARWQGKFNFEVGDYDFITGFNEGVNVNIDNQNVFTNNYPAKPSGYNTFRSHLTTGSHTLGVEGIYDSVYSSANTNQSGKTAVFDWAPAGEKYIAKYYNGTSFEDVKTKVTSDLGRSAARLEEKIDINLNNAGPYDGVNSIFGAVWEKQITVDNTGSYDFIAAGDKWIKLLVDGNEIFQGTGNGSQLAYKYQRITLLPGPHTIKFFYAGDGGTSGVRFYAGIPPKNEFVGIYYNNKTLSGAPGYVAYDQKLEHNWGTSSPGGSVPADNFSAKYEGTFDFDEGEYLFVGTVDDYIRLYVDDVQVFARWDSYTTDAIYATQQMTKGKHRVRVEYVETVGGANIKLKWFPTKDKFIAVYKNEYNGNSQTVYVGVEDKIDHNFGTGSPSSSPNDSFVGSGVWSDSFSGYWSGNFNFEAGDYYFNGLADDGIKIKVDGVEVATRWSDSNGQWITSEPVKLTAGNHKVEVDYYEHTGNAQIKVNWVKASSDNVFLAKYYYVNSYDELWGKLSSWQKPDYVEVYNGINFDFSENQFVSKGFNSRKWGVVFSGNMTFEEGKYQFAGIADDRMDVWLDWHEFLLRTTWNNGLGYKFAEKDMTAGTHHLDAVYFQEGGSNAAKLIWLNKGDNKFYARYYNNESRSGDPVYIDLIDGNSLNFDWGTGSPSSTYVHSDQFSAVYEGDFDFKQGWYVFNIRSDDKTMLYIDGKAVIPIEGRGTDTVQYLSGGKHNIKLTYTENGGAAKVQMSWQPYEANTYYETNYAGSDVYNNAEPSSKMTLVSFDGSLNYSWGNNGPGYLGSDNFSVSYEGVFNFEEGKYLFSGMADDGARIWVDDKEITSGFTWTINHSTDITKGKHRVRVWYREYGGLAKIDLKVTKQ